jgi:hypothetical protein
LVQSSGLDIMGLRSGLVSLLAILGTVQAYTRNAPVESPRSKVAAPKNCIKLPIDADWPSHDVLNAELNGWEPRMEGQSFKHPDYTYEVKSVASVQRAVRFAAKHNIRISILNSGHDFLGRYVSAIYASRDKG